MYHSKWYKWIALFLFLIFLLCFFLKCCTGPSSNNHIAHPLPSNPNRIQPVDPDKVEPVEEDPFKRDAVNDLINVYLKEKIDLKSFSKDFQTKNKKDKISPTYFADEYKRIQFKVEKPEMKRLMAELKKDTAAVKFVTREWVFRKSKIGQYNDPGFTNKKMVWFYEAIGLNEAWSYTKGNDSVKIAVIDDGFDLSHKELKGQSLSAWNVFNYSDDVYGNPKNLFHGTHVAGTVVGNLNNSYGISGVAPNCKFIPVQISDRSGLMTTTSILDGIFYALKNDANIINLSLGFSYGKRARNIDSKEQKEIEDNKLKDEEGLWDEVFSIAKKSNVVIVQAAGNDNILSGVDPMKRSQNCINVGAINSSLNRTEFSNYGDKVSVYAPGKGIYSSIPNDKMGFLDGTSMASPIVAGCVALIKSYRPNLNAEEIIDLLKESARNNKYNLIRIDEILNLL